MQLVVELARKHWQHSARVFIKRPESGIKAGKGAAQSPHCTVKQVPSGTVLRGESIVINPPNGPNKAVENMSRGPNNIFLKPSVPMQIDIRHPTVSNPNFE